MLARTERSARTGDPFSMEYRLLAKDGHVVWVQEEAILVERDDAGRPRFFNGLMLDVTERKEAEAKRDEAQRRLRALVDQIRAIMYIELPTAPAGESQLLYLSPQVEEITGYTPEELMGDPGHLLRMLHPDDRERILAANARSDSTGEPFDEEYRIFAKNGRVVWLHSTASLVRDQAGRPLYWHGVTFDVTDRHERDTAVPDLERPLAG